MGNVVVIVHVEEGQMKGLYFSMAQENQTNVAPKILRIDEEGGKRNEEGGCCGARSPIYLLSADL